MTERHFLKSGRNTIIHKIRRINLLIINGHDYPPILVTHSGIKEYLEPVPQNKREAKSENMELLTLTSPDVFSEEKTLLFVQAINGKEYKVDYSKVGTALFITVHQENVF